MINLDVRILDTHSEDFTNRSRDPRLDSRQISLQRQETYIKASK